MVFILWVGTFEGLGNGGSGGRGREPLMGVSNVVAEMQVEVDVGKEYPSEDSHISNAFLTFSPHSFEFTTPSNRICRRRTCESSVTCWWPFFVERAVRSCRAESAANVFFLMIKVTWAEQPSPPDKTPTSPKYAAYTPVHGSPGI